MKSGFRAGRKGISMDIKVGDKVLVQGRFSKSVQTVEKITPKGNIRVSNGALYDISGSEKTKDVWNSTTIVPLTPELEEQLHKEVVVARAIKAMHDTKTLTYNQAVKIMEILP